MNQALCLQKLDPGAKNLESKHFQHVHLLFLTFFTSFLGSKSLCCDGSWKLHLHSFEQENKLEGCTSVLQYWNYQLNGFFFLQLDYISHLPWPRTFASGKEARKPLHQRSKIEPLYNVFFMGRVTVLYCLVNNCLICQ